MLRRFVSRSCNRVRLVCSAGSVQLVSSWIRLFSDSISAGTARGALLAFPPCFRFGIVGFTSVDDEARTGKRVGGSTILETTVIQTFYVFCINLII